MILIYRQINVRFDLNRLILPSLVKMLSYQLIHRRNKAFQDMLNARDVYVHPLDQYSIRQFFNE